LKAEIVIIASSFSVGVLTGTFLTWLLLPRQQFGEVQAFHDFNRIAREDREVRMVLKKLCGCFVRRC